MNILLVRVLCVALAVGLLAAPAMAEVQNIKLDGQITIRGFVREHYTTTGSGGGRTVTGFTTGDSRDWYNTIVHLGVTADLTDNVMAKVGILNERDWQTAITDERGLGLETAAIILKEVLYSPLTVKAGRMPIQVGDGLILGDGVTDETNVLGTDYSAQRSFDTIHGILDYDPLTLIIGTLKFSDNEQAAGDDVDGYMIDAIYKFADGKTVMDTYFLAYHFSSPGGANTGPADLSDQSVDVYTFASRIMSELVNGLMLDATAGVQFGDFRKRTGQPDRDLRAWAANFGMQYMFDSEFAPKIGVKYIYRSGDSSNPVTGTGDYKGWMPGFTNQVNGIIYNPLTNTNSLGVSGSIMPLDRLTLGADFWWYRLAKKRAEIPGATSTKKSAGTGIDVLCRYAYTEDVSLGLSVAHFFPGKYYVKGNDKTAKQFMVEMGVRF